MLGSLEMRVAGMQRTMGRLIQPHVKVGKVCLWKAASSCRNQGTKQMCLSMSFKSLVSPTYGWQTAKTGQGWKYSSVDWCFLVCVRL